MNTVNIISDSQILGGKPIIEGTRISVALIVGLVASGMTEEEILNDYPTLTKEAIRQALFFASQRLDKETVHPITVNNKGIPTFPAL